MVMSVRLKQFPELLLIQGPGGGWQRQTMLQKIRQGQTDLNISLKMTGSQLHDSIQCNLTDYGPSFNPVCEQCGLEVVIGQTTRVGHRCVRWILLLVLTEQNWLNLD